ncbi:MAG: hypothetical protein EBT37_03425 [Betaproteobacteria bacterium]|jgi:DNA-binding transcriptional MerR regulator|nr:hypothetical protein [Betaproteobacteria bacterium]
MSDGHDASPPTQSVAEPEGNPAAVALTAAAPAKHQSLAQQMQVFLTRTDIQQSRKNRFYLQQVFELLSELDQHAARQEQLQGALQETQERIAQIKQSLIDIAGDSVEAENEALAIAQARAHLAGLLRDKIVHEFR